jgi:hypothetical protein
VSALVWAVAAGVSLITWATEGEWWPLAAGWWFGLWSGDQTLMVASLLDGAVIAYYLKMRRYAASRTRDQMLALLFLVRLEQLLAITGNLAAALDDMGYGATEPYGMLAEHVLERIAENYRVKPLLFVSRVAFLVRRYGGKLHPLIAWAKDTIQTDQIDRQQQHLEQIARESTMITLALAPIAILVLFRLMIPTFFRVLSDTRLGAITVAVVSTSTAAVFSILSRYHRQEADEV